jgi:hypothetical protein
MGGATHEVVHLWQYESYAHRAEVRRALGADAEWQAAYMRPMLPMLVAQQNAVLNKFPWAPVTRPGKAGGAYELRQYTARAGTLGAWQAAFKNGFAARSAYSMPVFMGFSEFGALNQIVHLWHYASLDDRIAVRTRALADPQWPKTVAETAEFLQTMNSKVLVPTSWSPLQ